MERLPAGKLAAAAVILAAALTGCGSSQKTVTRAATPATTGTTPAARNSAGYTTAAFASGVPITIATPSGNVSIYQPDDITKLGSDIFVGFQNDVGPQGQPTPKGNPGTGNRDSTIVEFSSSGAAVRHWNVVGHADGLTADPATGKVIATVNEDANAGIYVIDPSSATPVRYHVPRLPHHGGLDAISFYRGMMLISASAPGTTGKPPPQPSYPAVYVVSLDSSNHTASLRGLFYDEAVAKRANSGETGTTHLALTDPDSNEVVPPYAQRYGGDFELDSQGDKEEIFVAGTSGQQLARLKLSQSIDDSAWMSGSSGTLFVTDASNDLVWKVTGPFHLGTEIVSVTPCDASNAPMACPAPGFPKNYLGELNQSTGVITKLALPGTAIQSKGLTYAP